jgi:hypothetical protein
VTVISSLSHCYPPPPPPPRHRPSSHSLSLLCFHLAWASLFAVRIFCHPLLTAPFTSNLDVSSGCLGGMCSLPPPYLLSGVLNLQTPQALPVFSRSFRTTPFSVPPGCLGGSAPSLPPPPGGTYDSCRRLSISQACLASFLVAALCTSK